MKLLGTEDGLILGMFNEFRDNIIKTNWNIFFNVLTGVCAPIVWVETELAGRMVALDGRIFKGRLGCFGWIFSLIGLVVLVACVTAFWAAIAAASTIFFYRKTDFFIRKNYLRFCCVWIVVCGFCCINIPGVPSAWVPLMKIGGCASNVCDGSPLVAHTCGMPFVNCQGKLLAASCIGCPPG